MTRVSGAVLLAATILVGILLVGAITTVSSAPSGPLAAIGTASPIAASTPDTCHGPAQQDVDHASSVLPGRPLTSSTRDLAPLLSPVSTSASPVALGRAEGWAPDPGVHGIGARPSAPTLQVFRI